MKDIRQTIWAKLVMWLGIMAVLTLIAMGVWMVLWGGSQCTESLKWLQLMQTSATFLIPPILCACVWEEHHKPFKWLKLDRVADWRVFLLAVGIMVCAIPGINLLAELNGRIELPDSLDLIEQKLKAYEESAALLTERFLAAENAWQLLINIALMALLPALSEELTFRGVLQQIICKGRSDKEPSGKVHVAIWVTAFVFSAIHMQFYGFIPRMLLGALFGYVFVWSGSLWVPIVMHFTNNGLAVLFAFFSQHTDVGTKIADTFGAGDTWYIGVLSLLITFPGLLIFYRRTRKR